MPNIRYSSWIIFIAVLNLFCGCTKLVNIPPPTSTITTQETFKDSSNATAAVIGIYTSLAISGSNMSFATGNISMYCGLSADELVNFQGNPFVNQIYLNKLTSTSGIIYSSFWEPAYQIIYQANACVDGIQTSSGISDSTKIQLIAEAKTLRAFCYFYLVNLFGDVPYVTTINWKTTSLLKRFSSPEIYSSIISDLVEAEKVLKDDYSMSSGNRIRVNKSVVNAFLSRVYLYTKDWKNASDRASKVIANPNYSIDSSLNSVFLENSAESILQWNLNVGVYPFNATSEGFNLVPFDTTSQPLFVLSQDILDAFEAGDLRKSMWITSNGYGGTTSYIPYKYKIGPNANKPNGPVTELYTVFRLAEQYLIRSEAQAQLGLIDNAVNDLNIIRRRAGLPKILHNLSQHDLLNAVSKERRVELFAEWGNRWFDLKRTGQIDSVMPNSMLHKNGGSEWQSYQQLYPIPLSEIKLNPNLIQNLGY